MVRRGILAGTLVIALLVSCGSSDDSGGGGGTGGSGGASTGGSGGASTGGTGGGSTGGSSGTGGSAGSGTGGSSTGGSAGSSTGGSAGSSGGAAGSSGGGGVTFLNYGNCPSTPPTTGDDCVGPALCCYQAGGPAFTCAAGVLVDGGGKSLWQPIQGKPCCPASEPTAGAACTSPGAIVCCYGSSGYRCGTPQDPTSWTTATGC